MPSQVKPRDLPRENTQQQLLEISRFAFKLAHSVLEEIPLIELLEVLRAEGTSLTVSSEWYGQNLPLMSRLATAEIRRRLNLDGDAILPVETKK